MRDKHILNFTNLLLITGGVIVMIGAVLKILTVPIGSQVLRTGLTLEAISFVGVLIYAFRKHLK